MNSQILTCDSNLPSLQNLQEKEALKQLEKIPDCLIFRSIFLYSLFALGKKILPLSPSLPTFLFLAF